jgi:hypothetical protein
MMSIFNFVGHFRFEAIVVACGYLTLSKSLIASIARKPVIEGNCFGRDKP